MTRSQTRRVGLIGGMSWPSTALYYERLNRALERRCGPHQSFDGVVVSAHERMLKPERAIYEVLLDRYGLKAGDCIFVDDSEKNVVGARAAGMRAVHFVEPIDLRAELRGLGVRL